MIERTRGERYWLAIAASLLLVVPAVALGFMLLFDSMSIAGCGGARCDFEAAYIAQSVYRIGAPIVVILTGVGAFFVVRNGKNVFWAVGAGCFILLATAVLSSTMFHGALTR